MPHKLSLVRRLAMLRRMYTGETDSSLLPAITAGVHQLVADDRAQLHEILDNDNVGRLFGDDELPPPPNRVRQAMLADAPTEGQRELESGILTAAGRAVNYLHLRMPADLLRPARVFRMIRPHAHELVLHLEGGALGPLLAELMPHVAQDELVGVPGLRARLHRRHVELYLVDDISAAVHLSNVSYRQWTAGLAFAESLVDMGELRWLGNDPTPLTDAERAALDTRHRSPGPAGLNSSLLRRFRIFGDALWSVAWSRGCETTKVEWTPQPSLGRVARLLMHPLFGLPGDGHHVRYFDESGLTLTDLYAPRCAMHPASSAPVLVLRPVPGPDGPLELSSPGWRAAASPWSAWQRALSVANPTFPRQATQTPSPLNK
ncbi:hypothetical protein JJ691_77370 [Kutzneria sp. CA-103260]|nr:hypothetical protein JJ691_77370 [Kutzneria sp. CA-103260]